MLQLDLVIYFDVTGLSVTITPTRSDSKILVMTTIAGACWYMQMT